MKFSQQVLDALPPSEPERYDQIQKLLYHIKTNPQLLQKYKIIDLVNVGDHVFTQQSGDVKKSQHPQYHKCLNLLKNTQSSIKCSKCHGTNISSHAKQTRSADEGATIFMECLSCQKRWKM